MNFLKRLWRKLLGVKTGAYESGMIWKQTHVYSSPPRKGDKVISWSRSEIKAFAYDPAEDNEKVMTGEVESYFD